MRTIFSVLLAILLQSVLIAGQGITLTNDYQKNSGLQWDWALESLKQFSFNPNDKVLDVGCGDGKITAIIAHNITKGSIVGLDISEKMIKQASADFKNKNLIFRTGTATYIPYKGKFDKVVSFCALHWVVDQEQALQSMRDCLKPNGSMLLVFPGKAPNNLASIAEKLIKSEKWLHQFPNFKQERVYFTADEYRALLKRVNLEVKSLIATENVTLYKNKEALIAWIKPLVNFADHLSPLEQNRFIEDIANQMLLNDPPQADGSIPIRHLKIEVIASKR